MDQQSISTPKKYSLGLIDCPWDYDNKQQNDPARGGIQYSTLTMKELMDIPLYKAFNDDSIIVVWATMPKLMDSFYDGLGILDVIYAWKFRAITALFVWIKLNKNAAIQPYGTLDFGWSNDEYIKTKDFYSGLGRYTNSNVEIAIIARRGKGLERLQKNVKQLIFAPIREHSAKPRIQYERLFRLYGNVPRIELFAREQNPPPEGWNFTGLDITGEDIRDWIKQYE